MMSPLDETINNRLLADPVMPSAFVPLVGKALGPVRGFVGPVDCSLAFGM